MSLIPEKNTENIYKLCRTCKENKELNFFRPKARECRKCTNKKDTTNNERHRNFYSKHKETIRKQNLERYYITKNKKLQEFENIFNSLICAQ